MAASTANVPATGNADVHDAASGSGLSPALDHLLGIILPLVVPATEALVQDAIQQAAAKLEQSHPDKSIWEIFGQSIAQILKSGPLFDKLHLTAFIAKASDFSHNLITKVNSDPNLRSLRDVARLVDTKAIAETLENGAKVTAGEVRKQLFEAEPTGAIEGMVAAGKVPVTGETPSLRKEVANVLAKMGQSDMAVASPSQVFKANPEILAEVPPEQQAIVVNEVNTLARVQTIAPTTTAMQALAREGLTSAHAVVSMSKPQFVKRMATSLSVSEASEAHDMSSKVALRAHSALHDAFEAINGVGLATVGGAEDTASQKLQFREALAKRGINLNLEDLFGPMEQGSFDNVQTVYSASAYFVDLLLYLREHTLVKVAESNTSGQEADLDRMKGTVLEKLLRRRPDLQNLELTLENTNTLIPYVDLVNEVLESFVIHLDKYLDDTNHPRQTIIDAFNVGTEDANELLSQPQNVRVDAYRKLAAAVYPADLPYHQPLDAQRIFLEFLGVSRADLVNTFRRRPRPLGLRSLSAGGATDGQVTTPKALSDRLAAADARLTDLQRIALDSQYDSELLGICQEEFLILTKEVFWKKEYFELTEGTPGLTSEEYGRRIGQKSTSECWGYSSEDTMLSGVGELGLRFVKRQLLPRSGLTYAELVDIVQTRFLNSSMPTGKDKTILQSLRFSYRFLQKLVDQRQLSRKYDRLAAFLSKNMKIISTAERLRTLIEEGDTTDLVDSSSLFVDDDDMKRWVRQNFGPLGQTIVLESGQGPTLALAGNVMAQRTDSSAESLPRLDDGIALLTDDGRLFKDDKEYRSAKIGVLNPDGTLVNVRGAVIGQTGLNGAVYYRNILDENLLTAAFPSVNFSIWSDVSQNVQIAQLVDGKLQSSEGTLESVWVLNEGMGGTSSIEDVCLMHLDGSQLDTYEWDRLHRFTKLWRKLGWSVNEVDRAITCLYKPMPKASETPQLNGISSNGDLDIASFDVPIKFENFVDTDPDAASRNNLSQPDVTREVIEQLAAIKQIQLLCSMTLEQLLTLWSNMTSQGPKSQYFRLFFKRNLRDKDPVFGADRDGNYFTGKNEKLKISDHALVIMAALSLKRSELDYLIQGNGDESITKLQIPDVLNIENLSRLYAHYLFARMLGVKITDIFQIRIGMGDPFTAPTKTLRILKRWQKLKSANMTWQELRYVVDDIPAAQDPLALTQIESVRVSKKLRDSILAIQAQYPVDIEGSIDRVRAVAAYYFESSTVDQLVGLLDGSAVYSTAAPTIKDQEAELVVAVSSISASKKAKYIPAPKVDANSKSDPSATLQIAGILDEEEIQRLKQCILTFLPKGASAAKNANIGAVPVDDTGKELVSRWNEAVDRLCRKPRNFYFEALSGLFPRDVVLDETSGRARHLLAPDKPAAEEKNKAQSNLITTNGNDNVNGKAGGQDGQVGTKDDVPAPNGIDSSSPTFDSKQPNNAAIPSTSSTTTSKTPSEKISFFLRFFMPLLQKKLARNSMVDTIASAAGFQDPEIAKTLLEDVIKVASVSGTNIGGDTSVSQSKQPNNVNGSTSSALDFLMQSVDKSINQWQGYITTETTDEMVFILEGQSKPGLLQIVELQRPDQINASLFGRSSALGEYLQTFRRTPPLVSRLEFVQVKNAPEIWMTTPITMTRGKIYATEMSNEVKSKLKWQRPRALAEQIPANSFVAWWKGYISPPSTDNYSFSVTTTSKPVSDIVLDGTSIEFTIQEQEDPPGIWSTEPTSQRIDATRLHTIELTGILPQELSWRAGTNMRAPIPESALLPDIATMDILALLTKLQKLALLTKHYKLTSREILYINANATQFSGLGFDGIRNVEQWERLHEYVTLRNKLVGRQDQTLIDLFAWASNKSSSSDDLVSQIAYTTSWDRDSIDYILSKVNFSSANKEDFVNEIKLARIEEMVALSRKLDISVMDLFAWASPLGTREEDFKHYDSVSHSIQKLARSRFDVDAWAEAVRPLNNKLRENQKAALVSYILVQQEFVQNNNIIDADSLFEFFLIDVQMKPIVETSRLVQATSSVQLFVQRCMLGLEEGSGVPADVLDQPRWEWLQKYRVWEANRKIFLYPENWIEPSLRDDKTEFFQQLEAELMQSQLTNESLATAVKSYLYSVDNVSNLKAVGLYVDQLDNNRLHLFARTRTNPFQYFYNNYLPGALGTGYWQGWQSMKIEVPVAANPDNGDVGTFLSPIVFQGRLFVFLADFRARTVMPENKGDVTFKGLGDGSVEQRPKQGWEIKMSYTELRNGKWTARLSSSSVYQEEASFTLTKINNFVVVPCLVQADATHTDPIGMAVYLYNSTKIAANVMDTILAGWTHDGTQFSKVDDTKGQIFFRPSGATTGTPAESNFHVISIPTASNLRILPSLQARTTMSSAITPDERGITLAGIDPQSIADWKRTNTITGRRTEVDNIPSYVEDADSFHGDGMLTTVKSGPKIIIDGAKQAFFNPYSHDILRASAVVRSSLVPVYDILGGFGVDDGGSVDPGTAKYDEFKDAFGGSSDPGNSAVINFNEQQSMVTIYMWELGLHVPMLVIDRLYKDQQYEQALAACHHVFDPKGSGKAADTRRFWRFPPFKSVGRNTIESFFFKLKANEENPLITQWKAHPFQPHLIARGRPQAYMKWIVMTYIKILIGWGDSLFRQNTLESIPQAIQMYVIASHLYGPRGYVVPRQAKVKPQTFRSLQPKLDAFANALVQTEQDLTISNQTPLSIGKLPNDSDIYLPNVFGFAGTLYFAIPDNPDMRALADLIDDRLFKIRNSQDINGKFRTLPLFAPPIDPGLLVQAAAQGLSIGSVLQDLQGPLPNCKFHFLLQKALDLVGDLRSLGQSLISIRERKDAELLTTIRQKHEVSMQNILMDMKNLALDEANKSLEILQYNRTGVVSRLTHYLRLIGNELSGIPALDQEFEALDAKIEAPISEGGLGLSKFEDTEMQKNKQANDISFITSIMSSAAGVLHLAPSGSVLFEPLGVGGSLSYSGSQIASFIDSLAKGIAVEAQTASYEAAAAGRLGSHQRALQDRVLQANLSGYEISGIDKQITAQQIRISMASKEISIQQQQIDQSNEISDFLRDKYTSQELYGWLDSTTKALFYQVYSEAFALAKRAEKAFKYERPQNTSTFIQSGYWDASRDGLLSGESLYLGLKQLEAAYIEERGYDYEITKHVSLRMLDPLKLLTLRETQSCEFSLPEFLFDLDFPGHFLRRVRSVSLTIPCVVGPYTSINATLSLTSSEYRVKPTPNDPYFKNVADGDDDRFSSVSAPITSIAVCSGQNDAGVFQLEFGDQGTRYLPFEGAGAISSWKLTLPEIRQFDYNTIYDVVMQIRYTSIDGGEPLRKSASDSVKKVLERVDEASAIRGSSVLFDIKNEYASAWSQATQASSKNSVISLGDITKRLPFMTRGATLGVQAVKLITDQALKEVKVTFNNSPHPLGTPLKMAPDHEVWRSEVADLDEAFGSDWSIDLGVGPFTAQKCLMVVDYKVTLP